MAEYDQNSEVKHVAGVSHAAITATTTTSAAIDTLGYESVTLLASSGSATMDGSFTVALTEGDTSGGAFTAVATGDMIGGSATTPFGLVFAIGDEDLHLRAGYRGKKQWVKVVVTETAANTTGVIGGSILLGNPKTIPVTAQNAV